MNAASLSPSASFGPAMEVKRSRRSRDPYSSCADLTPSVNMISANWCDIVLSLKERPHCCGRKGAALVGRQRGLNLALQKITHQVCDLLAVCFQSEVTRVNQMVFEIFQITLVRFCTSGWEDLVMLAPND